METRPYIHTAPFADAAAAVAGARAAVGVAPTAKGDELMTCVMLPRIAHSGNGDVDALVARRMR